MDLCEFEATWSTRASSRTGSKAKEKPCLENEQTNKKQSLLGAHLQLIALSHIYILRFHIEKSTFFWTWYKDEGRGINVFSVSTVHLFLMLSRIIPCYYTIICLFLQLIHILIFILCYEHFSYEFYEQILFLDI